MRTILNLFWLVLSGFWLFLGYVAAGIVLCVLIITIPWGIASFRIQTRFNEVDKSPLFSGDWNSHPRGSRTSTTSATPSWSAPC